VDRPGAGSGRSTRAGCTRDNALDVARDGPGVFDRFGTADLALVFGLGMPDESSLSTTMDIGLAGKGSMPRSGESSLTFGSNELTRLDRARDLALCAVRRAGVGLPSALDQHTTFFCMQCLHDVSAKPVLLLNLVIHSISFSTHPWHGSSCIWV
jgi:hypothetical protein